MGMTTYTDHELLVELSAKYDWLRDHPTGMAAQTTKQRIKEIEHQLDDRDVDAGERAYFRQSERLPSSTVWYVANGGQCKHHDPDCLHLADSEVQTATDLDLPICSTCG